MQYVGGKQKSGGAQIARRINGVIERHGLETYSEPFCGGLSVTARIRAPKRRASDACEALITLYRAMHLGWEPPTELGPDEWARLRASQDPGDPMTAFAGFGCSFGGSWFGSYVAHYKYTKRWVTSAEAAANSLTKKIGACVDVTFEHHDYRAAPLGELVYCDPPYRGTLGYGAVGTWDSEAFWAWASAVGSRRMVAVSEIEAPAGWVPLLSFDVQHRIGTATGKRRSEHIFVLEQQRDAWEIQGTIEHQAGPL